jgi:2-polyprenyl-3-methyl-5-hydroxy-6-metoxy-1,4-benzoquinol methylase
LTPDTDRARSYFDALAPEYDRAFKLTGRNPLSALINRFFRGPTFARRMRKLESLLDRLGMKGTRVLDLGCGSGQVSLLAASMGAHVQAIDIAPRMLEIARESAQHAGLGGQVVFTQGDIAVCALSEADVVLLVGVVEYYQDFAPVVARAAAAAKRHLVIAHTNRVFYRMLLRRRLFAVSGASVYFHPMSEVIAAATRDGLTLAEELRDHAYTILVFERRG